MRGIELARPPPGGRGGRSDGGMASSIVGEQVRGPATGPVTGAARLRQVLRRRPRTGPRRASIQAKLVIAFLLVSLVPMLVAAKLTARVVSAAFDQNIETWLTETSSFLLNEIVSGQREATGLARFVLEHTSMASQIKAGTRELPSSVAA